MKNFLNPILLFSFILITSCGYVPLNSKQEIEFYIGEINFEGDRKINSYISNNLEFYKNMDGKLKSYNLKIISTYKKDIKNKDIKGNPKNYNLALNCKVIIETNNGQEIIQRFSREISYAAKKNKITENELEKKYKEDLSNLLSKDIIFFLVNNT